MTHPLMQYLPPIQQAPQQQVHQRQPQQANGASKYVGAIATSYDAKRENDPKWTIEQRIIEGLLADLPEDTIVLDCPVGTGRFLPFYAAKGLQILGMDISLDMLKQAEQRDLPRSPKGDLRQGDVRATGLPDKSVDVSVNCRITRWLSPEDCQQMLREMQRVARKRMIWTARVANHPHARTVELFEAALDGWKIVRNEAGVDLDYRILMAEPIA